MDKLKIDLRNKRNVFAILVTLVALAGGYFFYDSYLIPLENDIDTLQLKVDKLQKDLDDINRQKGREAQLEQQLAEAQQEFEKLKEMFPEQEEVPRRLQDLYGVIRSSGVTITDFEPASQAEKEYYVENVYSIGVHSGYHMMGYLFAEIANFKYPTSITNLKIGRYADIEKEIEKASMHGWTPITTKTTFNLTTFTSRKNNK